MTVHAREYEQIFSLNKQADIKTPVAVGQVNKQRSLRGFSPSTEQRPAIVSDRAWYGKGHSHPTFYDVVQRFYAIDAQERSATNLETLYAAAYVMGSVVTTQPDSAGAPDEYLYTITWQDLSVNKEVLYTTMYEKMGAEWTKRLSGVYLNSFTLTGARDDHVVLSFDGAARKREDAVITSPGISSAVFFKTLCGQVKNQNPDQLWLIETDCADSNYLSEVLIGDQTVTGSITIKVDAAEAVRFQDEVVSELWLIAYAPGSTINTNLHSMTIKIPNLVIAEESFGEEGQTVSYTLTFSEESVLKSGSDEHLQIEILTTDFTSELLVAA